MAFLLGSLTGGFFGGLNDTASAMMRFQQLKQMRMQTDQQQRMIDAANAVQQASQASNGQTQPQTTESSGQPSSGTAAAPSKPPASWDNDPLLQNLPAPRLALGDDSSPNEGQPFGSPAPASASAGAASPQPAAPARPSDTGAGALGNWLANTAAPATERFLGQAGAAQPVGVDPSTGSPVYETPAAPRQNAPQYLPNSGATSPNQAGQPVPLPALQGVAAAPTGAPVPRSPLGSGMPWQSLGMHVLNALQMP